MKQAEDNIKDLLRQRMKVQSGADDPFSIRNLTEILQAQEASSQVMTLPQYPDYYSMLPGARTGHRSMEPEPLMKSELGDEAANLVDTHHMMWMFNRFAITQAEAHDFTAQLPGWWKRAAMLVIRSVLDLPWLLKWGRSRRICTGCAGIARLRLSMMDRNIPLWLRTQLVELLTDAEGRVTGAVIEREGKRLRVQARKGVVLAAGGFEHNQQMREQYLPKPTEARWSGGIRTNTGDAIREGMRLGAATRLMSDAWWCTTITVPGEPSPRLSIRPRWRRSRPRSTSCGGSSRSARRSGPATRRWWRPRRKA